MPVSHTINLLIADDHVLVREGLASLIQSVSNMHVVGLASDGAEAVRLAQSLHPDVIVMDLLMPGMGGIEAIDAIMRYDPNSRILVLTSFDEDERVYEAVRRGALGYLLKSSSSTDLVRAIEQVHRGEFSLQPSMAMKVVHEVRKPAGASKTVAQLTLRENEVLRLMARGMTDREIADRLFLSTRTVHKHVANILNRLQMANRTQAALYAVREGLDDSDG